MKYTVEALSRLALWWADNRPFSEEARARRQARRAQRRAERAARRKGVELSSEAIEYEVTDMSLREKIGNLRTSTKAGAAGLGTMGGMAVMLIPFAEEAEALIQQACQSENGAVPFLVGGAIVWAVTVVSARLSRTPEKPGAI